MPKVAADFGQLPVVHREQHVVQFAGFAHLSSECAPYLQERLGRAVHGVVEALELLKQLKLCLAHPMPIALTGVRRHKP